MRTTIIAQTLCLALPVLGLTLPGAPARAELPFNPNLLSDVAEKVTPAVVNITTRRSRTMEALPDGHPMFRDFFGPGRRRGPTEMGAGSGVVVSADGDIVTNNHVIEGADDIVVTFSDKRELKARLVGTDKPADLAFLKVEGKNLPFIPFGDSSALRLGEIVLAVGNPFGVGQTVTMGIVSAKGRANVGIIDYEDFIQTDASINPGNSGGALVNLKGELVGINTAILSRSGGAQGIGFAVPSNMVRPIREQISEHGRVRRGWLGVAIQDLTPDIARSMGLKEQKGVLVSDVMEGGPAARASINVGDVIVQVNDRPTPSASELRNAVALLKPGTKAKLAVVHDGKTKELAVTLDEKKDEQEVAEKSKDDSGRLLAGLSLTDLDGALRQRLSVPGKVTGAVVTAVEDGSPAQRAGLEEGDVITAVGRERIKGAADVGRLVPKTAGEVLLRVFKRGVFTFVVLRQ
ncbi:MAG: DegQ family serine endoprotease [Deltaproteobacteria bacterium]|jgi:serine protease Do|nr:DegQ family serine endoprotease [Deltaproteobacteria bacterium]